MSRGLVFIACVHLLVGLSLCGFQNGDMRLAGGKEPSEGRVEVYVYGVWGTVCDDGWDIREALVVCRHLNFTSAREAVDGGVYGPGQGPILMDNLNCLGEEQDLTKCESPGLGISDCKHAEDAGVVCTTDDPSREYSVEHSAGVSERLGQLFDSRRDCDLILSVTVENSTVETICAHKLVLSLGPRWASRDNLSIEVSSGCQPHAAHFVRYLYTGQINITLASALCIHKMASDWGVKALQEEAGKLFTLTLPEDPTFRAQSSLFEYAVVTGDGALQSSCLRYMAWNGEALAASPAWTGLSPRALGALLSRTDLTVPSEYFVLLALERWEAARGGSPGSGDPFDLLRHVRFPMISAAELHRLRDPRYQAGKLQGFQFNALAGPGLSGELAGGGESYTPRVYTGAPWSVTYGQREVADYKHTGRSGVRTYLSVTFRTPPHASAYFALFAETRWNSQLFLRSEECSHSVTRVCPSAALSADGDSSLPEDLRNAIVYENKVVLRCDGRYVSHIQDFRPQQDATMIPANKASGQVYPCPSQQYSYTFVVRPKYRTGVEADRR